MALNIKNASVENLALGTAATEFSRFEGSFRLAGGFLEADRFVAEGIRFEIEDILVNGGPWNTRVAVRAHDYIEGSDGDSYNNRVVAFLTIRWGRLVAWEDYEDTERVAAWDRASAGRTEASAG